MAASADVFPVWCRVVWGRACLCCAGLTHCELRVDLPLCLHVGRQPAVKHVKVGSRPAAANTHHMQQHSSIGNS
jgi:hypothetical protein